MTNTLKNSVIRALDGKDSLRDVSEHGADCGVPGFTYYTDTCKFFRNHKAEIVAHAEELAADLGENVLHMVKSFRCLNNDFSESEVARVLYGNWKEDDAHNMIGNAMAWFALEEVAREVCDS